MGFKIITDRDVTFNENEIPYLSDKEIERNLEVGEGRRTKFQV